MDYYQESSMNNKNPVEQLGICATCNSIDNCIHRKDQNGHIFYCDEYNGIDTSENNESEIQGTPIKHKNPIKKEQVFKGLCINCQKRFECTYALTNGGVWHCNEYV